MMTSYDVKSLFTCIPPQGALEAVQSRLRVDNSLGERTQLSIQNVCEPLELCLTSMYFVFKGCFTPRSTGGNWFAYLTGGVRHLCGEHRGEGIGVFHRCTSQGLVALHG